MNVLYVAGMHKSGTSLLRNLLVGVPGLCGPSFELHPYEAAGSAVAYPLRRRKSTNVGSADEAMARIEREARSLAESADRYGGGIPSPEELRALARAVAAAGAPWPSGQAHRADRLIRLVAEALESEPHHDDPRATLQIRWAVEKSVENLEFVVAQLAATPSARVVHIVRHPAAVLAAVRRAHHLQCPRPGCTLCRVKFLNRIRAVAWALRHGTMLGRDAPTRSVKLHYEDLVADPAGSLINVGRSLGIEHLLDVGAVERAVAHVAITNSSAKTTGVGVTAARAARWQYEATVVELLAAHAFAILIPDPRYPAAEVRDVLRRRLRRQGRSISAKQSCGHRPDVTTTAGASAVLSHLVARLNPRRDVDLAATGLSPWRFLARGIRVAITPRGWMLPARFPNGLTIKGYNRPGYGGRGVYMFRDKVEPELALVDALLGEGDWAIDVGSCVGTYAVNAAKAVGTSGAVIAVDPSPAAMAVLSANADSNGLANVIKICAAASDVQGFDSFDFTNDRPDARGLRTDGAAEATAGALVPTVTIDGLVDTIGAVKRVRVMKIDAEGAEERVLRGARATIESWKPVLVIEQAVRIVMPPPGYGAWATPTSRNHVWIHESDEPGRAIAGMCGFNEV